MKKFKKIIIMVSNEFRLLFRNKEDRSINSTTAEMTDDYLQIFY